MDGNTTIVTKGADMAVKKGIAVFTAAGNEGNNSWYHIIAPADGDSVIAIGNVTSTGIVNSGSSRGPTSDGRIKPDLVAQGTGVHTITTYDNSGFTSASGTSFSTPLAAGAGALVLSFDNSLTPMQLYNALIMNASNFYTPNNDIGYGIINIAPIIGETDPDQDSQIIVSPNPFSEYVHIELKYPLTKSLIVYNSLGQKIKTFKENKSLFIWNGYSNNNKKVASGVYFVVLKHNNSLHVKKLVYIK